VTLKQAIEHYKEQILLAPSPAAERYYLRLVKWLNGNGLAVARVDSFGDAYLLNRMGAPVAYEDVCYVENMVLDGYAIRYGVTVVRDRRGKPVAVLHALSKG